MPETPQTPQTQAESTEDKPEMCCDGQQTAAEHRQHSEDGKCCIDD
ncbi:MAG: hypothetical protein ACRD0O_17690 [Acidimicrobiia bacterium]